MKTLLTHRLSQFEIKELCALTHGARNNHLKEKLYQLTLDADRRVAVNALWVFTLFLCQNNNLIRMITLHCSGESNVPK